MKKFEYLVREVERQETFDMYGMAGWELVGFITRMGNTSSAVFKRQIEEENT